MSLLHIPACHLSLPEIAHKLRLYTKGKWHGGACIEKALPGRPSEQESKALNEVSSPVCYAGNKHLRDGYKL